MIDRWDYFLVVFSVLLMPAGFIGLIPLGFLIWRIGHKWELSQRKIEAQREQEIQEKKEILKRLLESQSKEEPFFLKFKLNFEDMEPNQARYQRDQYSPDTLEDMK